jgi:hypothetical protein
MQAESCSTQACSLTVCTILEAVSQAVSQYIHVRLNIQIQYTVLRQDTFAT